MMAAAAPLMAVCLRLLAVLSGFVAAAAIDLPASGMKVGTFLTSRTILEVECSGESLPPDTDVMSIALYSAGLDDHRVLASVNLVQDRCLSSSGFAACELDRSNSRRTRVRVLVDNLPHGQSRLYGCDVSTFRAGERPQFVTWTLVVQQPRLRWGRFQGHEHVMEVECSGEPLASDKDLLSMVLFSARDNKVLATVNLKTRECATSDRFASCLFDERDSHKTRLRALVLDMAEGQGWGFGCNLTTFRTADGASFISWTAVARKSKTTTTTTQSTTTTSTTTVAPEPPTAPPRASGVKSKLQEFQLPVSVIIIGLVLLIFFAALCVILIILQCRGRRRRRSRAANRESLLSARNEPVGAGGYRTTRTTTTFPAPGMPPDGSGGNLAMRYQKSIPDTGYVSGSSVYYSEPYGTLDDEMKERLRPNPRMCHIPYDIKGGPLDPHAQAPEHSA